MVDSRLPMVDCRLPMVDCRLPIASWRLAIADRGLPRASTTISGLFVNCRFSSVGRGLKADGDFLVFNRQSSIVNRQFQAGFFTAHRRSTIANRQSIE